MNKSFKNYQKKAFSSKNSTKKNDYVVISYLI